MVARVHSLKHVIVLLCSIQQGFNSIPKVNMDFTTTCLEVCRLACSDIEWFYLLKVDWLTVMVGCFCLNFLYISRFVSSCTISWCVYRSIFLLSTTFTILVLLISILRRSGSLSNMFFGIEEGRSVLAFDIVELSFQKFQISSIVLSSVRSIPRGFGLRSCTKNSYVSLFLRALIMTYDCSCSVRLNVFCLIASRIVLALRLSKRCRDASFLSTIAL